MTDNLTNEQIRAIRRHALQYGTRNWADKSITDAQIRVIAWLPADGSWTIKSPGRLTSAFVSLLRNPQGLAEEEIGPFGRRCGKCRRRRLTSDGVIVRRDLDRALDEINSNASYDYVDRECE